MVMEKPWRVISFILRIAASASFSVTIDDTTDRLAGKRIGKVYLLEGVKA